MSRHSLHVSHWIRLLSNEDIQRIQTEDNVLFIDDFFIHLLELK